MNPSADETAMLRRYLLGKLPEDAQVRLEERLLTDDAFYGQLLQEEDCLVDDYAAGSLTSDERESFERIFLSSQERRANLRFASALHQYARESLAEIQQPQRPEVSTYFTKAGPGFRWLAVVTVAAIVAVILLTFRITSIWNEFSDLRSRGQQLEKQLDREREARRGLENQIQKRDRETLQREPFLITLALSPGLTRAAGDTPRAVITEETKLLRLRLYVADGHFRKFRVALVEGLRTEIWTWNELTGINAGGEAFVLLEIPVLYLEANDYMVHLREILAGGKMEEAGKYYFRVVRR